MVHSAKSIRQAYNLAAARYAELGVDTQEAIQALHNVSISIHCWQGDDIGGFETERKALGGGLSITGNHPGKARNADELRSDLEMALSLIPGSHRINLHAIYGEFGGRKVDRDDIQVKHFQSWIDWAKNCQLGLDFNPTCFSHPNANDGFTLSHADASIRRFWIDHCIACRDIGAAMGKALGTPAVTNLWIPDGYKDLPADRLSPRKRLEESLDEIFSKRLPQKYNLDAIEAKLFGIGSENYVVGSHEFYLGYAIKNQKILCLDSGHFHPTESIADKISSTLLFVPRLLLHVSRGVRWDSDHVVTLDDGLLSICQEIVRNRVMDRVHIGLDFFDASINRIAAWTIGTRNTLKSVLCALLEPSAIPLAEKNGDLTRRLALMEECKSLPWSAVWDYFCLMSEVPVGAQWMDEVARYERNVLSKR